MPLLVVHFIPEAKLPGEIAAQRQLVVDLRQAVANIAELGLTPDRTKVSFPVDRVEDEPGKRLFAMVEGLYEKPKRTKEVRDRLAKEIAWVLQAYAKQHLPNCREIGVLVKISDPDKDSSAELSINEPD